MWVKLRLRARFAFCGYSFPFDTAVSRPLGVRLLDSGIPFDSGLPLDSADPSDPFVASGGWLGLPVSPRLDGGHTLDSISSVAIVPEEIFCTFDRPSSAVAGSSYLEDTVSLSPGMGMSLMISVP